eukprot:4641082-Prymnesium_polylepis.2
MQQTMPPMQPMQQTMPPSGPSAQQPPGNLDAMMQQMQQWAQQLTNLQQQQAGVNMPQAAADYMEQQQLKQQKMMAALKQITSIVGSCEQLPQPGDGSSQPH